MELRCGAFKIFCGCHTEVEKRVLFTCRSLKWGVFPLPKPQIGFFSPAESYTNGEWLAPVSVPTNRIQPTKDRQEPNFTRHNRQKLNFTTPPFGTVKNPKRLWGGQEPQGKAAAIAKSRFSPIIRVNRLAFGCFFEEISSYSPENFRQAEKGILFTCRNLKWVAFHLPKSTPKGRGSHLSECRKTEFQTTKAGKKLI